jgi:two-component system, OmpR family, alkaline phosphatase synthesis response regulator PhoP
MVISLIHHGDLIMDQIINTWNVSIHKHRRKVFVEGQPVELTATEFRLLVLLVNQSGIVFSRKQILEGINDGLFAITDRAVDVEISGLRKRLRSAAVYLETVRGEGYRWSDPSDRPKCNT